MHDLGQQMTTSDLWHCILTFQRSSEALILADLIHAYSGWFGDFGVSWRPETENVAYFSHRHAYCTSLHYPMSIRAIDTVCHQAILPMRVTLFPSGMRCVTNIPSINGNDTLFCSELNVEHAGESFLSLHIQVFQIYWNTHFFISKHYNITLFQM